MVTRIYLFILLLDVTCLAERHKYRYVSLVCPNWGLYLQSTTLRVRMPTITPPTRSNISLRGISKMFYII